MAQPLTILRSSVVACSMPSLTPDQHQRYLNISVQQVERACSLFEHLQDLVVAMQIEPEHMTLDLEDLIGRLIEDQSAILQASGVSVRIAKHDGLRRLFGDAGRTRDALREELKVAVSTSSPGDVIEVLMETRDDWVECILRNERPHGRNLDSSQKLSLAVAETNIRTQQGRYQFVLDPLCISWALPTQSLAQ